MKLKYFLFILLAGLFPVQVLADGRPAAIEQLDILSDEAFQMVKNQRYEDAKKLLDYFSEQLHSMGPGRIPFSADEARIVSLSRDEALEAVASPTLEYMEKMNKVTRFRLVMDALATSSDPLWAELEDQVMGSFSGAKQAALDGNPGAFHASLNSFLFLYELIYPSMKIDIKANSMQKLDAKIDFLSAFSPSKPASESEVAEFDALEASLKNIFDGIEEDEADPSLWWVIISTGGIIILTLSYVGWRKYRADSEIAKKRSIKLKD
ncbi:sporulation protein YpjB [Bacillus sp. FJAT-27245]|uniref:sporulation protein YpjB n=1 Tax=Bacillus sp. FJAT-27245 TaxID=1684144 RepID=UPI0006A79940|nr:sporulation protein YpjB [Bacillus sp. FJAT-27245]